MQVLIVATASTPRGVLEQIEQRAHYRIDYLELAAHLGADLVDYGAVPVGRRMRALENAARTDLQQARHAARLAAARGYDVVVSLSERVGIPLSRMLRGRARHVVIMHHPMSAHRLRLVRMLGCRWDIVYALSPAEAEGLRAALGLGPEAVRVLQTPVDAAFFRPQARLASAEPAHILSLGLSYRDYPTLLRAMARVPHARCHIRAGSAWVDRATGFEGMPLPGNVELRPFVHPSVLRDSLTQSRFAAVPIRATTQWSAGCTTVQLAQAMGRAVVATRMPGLSDYVLDGETGLLVGCGDDAGMAEAIDELWRSPERAERMGRRGREWIESRFSLGQWVETLAADLGQLAEPLRERAVGAP